MLKTIVVGWTLAALVGLCAAQPQVSTLRMRLGGDIRSTDPGINRDGNSDMVVLHVVEGLVAYREDTTVGPLLASSVEASTDGLRYTFRLRHGIRFHNGAPLTGADVVYSWNRYMTPQSNWRCLGEFDGRNGNKVVSVISPDPDTVVFTLNRPYALFLTMLARTDCGGTGIYHRDSVSADGKWLEPIGTGPFKLGTWKRGQYIDLVRNDDYAALPGRRDGYTGNKTPGVAKVRFIVIPDASASKAALLSGGLDVLFDIDSEDLPELRRRSDLLVTTAATMNQVGILLQARRWPLSDARIRRAVALSLDLPLLVDTVTSGMSKASRSAIPRTSSFYTSIQAALPGRDLAQARRLLAESGYGGEVIKLLTTMRYKNLFEIAVLTQAMALEAGIRFEIEVHDWATLLDEYNKQKYDAMAFSFSSRVDPSLSYGMIVGAGDERTGRVWNDPVAQSLVSRSVSAQERPLRQALFDELDTRLREEVPVIFMYSSEKIAATRTYVKGYVGWPLLPRAWGVSFVKP